MIMKTVVNKNGNLDDYLHFPLLNENSTYPIGSIVGASEVESGYELTMVIFI